MNTKTVKLTEPQMKTIFGYKGFSDGVMFFNGETDNGLFFVCNHLKNRFTKSEVEYRLNKAFGMNKKIVMGQQLTQYVFGFTFEDR